MLPDMEYFMFQNCSCNKITSRRVLKLHTQRRFLPRVGKFPGTVSLRLCGAQSVGSEWGGGVVKHSDKKKKKLKIRKKGGKGERERGNRKKKVE